MAEEDRIATLERKLEQWRETDKKEARKNRLNSLAIISVGFAIAMTGLSYSNPHMANTAIAIFFYLVGLIIYVYSIWNK